MATHAAFAAALLLHGVTPVAGALMARAPAWPRPANTTPGLVQVQETCRAPACRRVGCDKEEPPGEDCCTGMMMKMLTDVTSYLDKQGAEYMVTFGTLLGGFRDSAIIPWTADVDIYISKEAQELLLRQTEIPYKFFVNDILRGCPDNANLPPREWTWKIDDAASGDNKNVFYYLDLYSDDFFAKEDKAWMPCSEGPPSTVTIKGQQFKTVHDPKACLEGKYGSDFMTPRKDTSYDSNDVEQARHGSNTTGHGVKKPNRVRSAHDGKNSEHGSNTTGAGLKKPTRVRSAHDGKNSEHGSNTTGTATAMNHMRWDGGNPLAVVPAGDGDAYEALNDAEEDTVTPFVMYTALHSSYMNEAKHSTFHARVETWLHAELGTSMGMLAASWIGCVFAYVVVRTYMYGSVFALPSGSVWDINVIVFSAYVVLAIAMRFAVRQTAGIEYSPALFLICVAGVKLLGCLLWFLLFEGNLTDLYHSLMKEKTTAALYVIPAVLYIGSDALVVISLWTIDPVTFTLLHQNLRDIIIVFAWQIMFNTRLDALRAIGIGTIIIGLVVKESDKVRLMGSGSPVIKVCWMLAFTAVLSAIAAVVNEKLLKNRALPFTLQNITLYTFTIIIALPILVVERKVFDKPVMPRDATTNDYLLIAGAIFVFAAFGICTALYLRHLGNISKIVCHAFVVILSVVVQIYWSHYAFSAVEIVGIVQVIIGMGLASLTESPRKSEDDSAAESRRSVSSTRPPSSASGEQISASSELLREDQLEGRESATTGH